MQKPDLLKMSVGDRWNLDAEVIKAVSKPAPQLSFLLTTRDTPFLVLRSRLNPLTMIIFSLDLIGLGCQRLCGRILEKLKKCSWHFGFENKDFLERQQKNVQIGIYGGNGHIAQNSIFESTRSFCQLSRFEGIMTASKG